jgi:hypothetical protein
MSGKSAITASHGSHSSWANIEKLFVKILVQPHPASELKQMIDERVRVISHCSNSA